MLMCWHCFKFFFNVKSVICFGICFEGVFFGTGVLICYAFALFGFTVILVFLLMFILFPTLVAW